MYALSFVVKRSRRDSEMWTYLEKTRVREMDLEGRRMGLEERRFNLQEQQSKVTPNCILHFVTVITVHVQIFTDSKTY